MVVYLCITFKTVLASLDRGMAVVVHRILSFCVCCKHSLLQSVRFHSPNLMSSSYILLWFSRELVYRLWYSFQHFQVTKHPIQNNAEHWNMSVDGAKYRWNWGKRENSVTHDFVHSESTWNENGNLWCMLCCVQQGAMFRRDGATNPFLWWWHLAWCCWS